MAHGWAGLLYAVLRWCRAAGEPVPDALPRRLRELAAWAEPHGRGLRWRADAASRARSPRAGDHLSSWCNGSAGHVHLWSLAHRMLDEPEHLALAEGAAWDAWDDPVGHGDLCCGLAGRAYALIEMWHASGDDRWLARARRLARRAVPGVQRHTQRPDALYKSSVGVAVLAAELAHPEHAAMPVFGDPGWPLE